MKKSNVKKVDKFQETNKYQAFVDTIADLNTERAKMEANIEAKIAKLKAQAGIDKLELKLSKIQNELHEMLNDKADFEMNILKRLITGEEIEDFKIKELLGKKSISYKGICDEVLKDEEKRYQKLKDKYTSQRQSHCLIWREIEIAKSK